ncbi:MAG TPA: hypothetical protein ENO24_04245 [Chloroflexi bacterium]|nr:hypothetical protein [Chloroflexota bacterium]
MPEIERRQLWQVICISVLVMALSSVPYLLGYLASDADWKFGGLVIDLDDGHSHLAKMQQGAANGWRYHILFTPEDHPGAYLNTFYVGLGQLSSACGLSVFQTYQLARLVCGLGLLVSAYVFVSSCLEIREQRLTAFLLICFSSGLGWSVLLTGSATLRGLSPMDFWLMEAYTFFTLMTFPHVSAAVALLLIFFLLALGYWRSFHVGRLLLSSLVLLAICVIQPFMVLLVDVVLGFYWVSLLVLHKRIPGREALSLMTWALVPLPPNLYYLQAFNGDPVFRAWAAQNILPSPPPTHLVLGYGIMLLLAIVGAALAIRRRSERMLFPIAWSMSSLLLMYAPFTLQRRMLEGVHIPLCILATVGLFEYLVPAILRSRWLQRLQLWHRYTRQGLRRLLVFAMVMSTVPSSLFLVARASVLAVQADSALFYRATEIEAMDWLASNTHPQATVLASYEVGRGIPGRIGHRVFMGHFIETVEVHRKRMLAAGFFQADTTDESRRSMLSEYGIRYVFHGPSEKEMGQFDPSGAPYLKAVYRNELVTIYMVQL